MTKFLIYIWLAFSLLCLLQGETLPAVLSFITALIWAAVVGVESLAQPEPKRRVRKQS